MDLLEKDFKNYLEDIISVYNKPPYLKKVLRKASNTYTDLENMFNVYLKVNLFLMLDAVHKRGYENPDDYIHVINLMMCNIITGKMEILRYPVIIYSDKFIRIRGYRYITRDMKNIDLSKLKSTEIHPPKEYRFFDLDAMKSEVYFYLIKKIIPLETSRIAYEGDRPLLCSSITYSRVYADGSTIDVGLFDSDNRLITKEPSKNSFYLFRSVKEYTI